MCVVSSVYPRCVVSVAENDGHSTSYILYSLYPPLSRLPAPAGSPGSMVCCILMRTEECALPGVFIHSLERDNTREFVAKTIKHVLIINMYLLR